MNDLRSKSESATKPFVAPIRDPQFVIEEVTNPKGIQVQEYTRTSGILPVGLATVRSGVCLAI